MPKPYLIKFNLLILMRFHNNRHLTRLIRQHKTALTAYAMGLSYNIEGKITNSISFEFR